MELPVLESWAAKFKDLKNGCLLAQFFSLFLDKDAQEEDLDNFIEFIERGLKCTLQGLDEQLERGIQDGYEIDDQLLIIQRTLAQEEAGFPSFTGKEVVSVDLAKRVAVLRDGSVITSPDNLNWKVEK